MMNIRIRDGKGEYKGYNCVDPIDPTGCTGIHVEALVNPVSSVSTAQIYVGIIHMVLICLIVIRTLM